MFLGGNGGRGRACPFCATTLGAAGAAASGTAAGGVGGGIGVVISLPNDAAELLKDFQSIVREASVLLPRAFLMAATISSAAAKRLSRFFSSAFMTMAETDSGIANSGFNRCGAVGGVFRC